MINLYEYKSILLLDICVGFLVLPEEIKYYLDLSKKPLELLDNLESQPDIIFKFSEETLNKIFRGELTGLTAAGRENMDDKTPLDIEFKTGVLKSSNLMNQTYIFIQNFFNPTFPEKIVMNKSHARMVHGAWAIPLFYHTGFRSAWYQVEKGQKLNKPGETNLFPQAFIILSGTGLLKLDDIETQVKPGEAYYIPPGSEHILWPDNSTPINLLYLAWGDKA
jgi:mannose-6-phosphate isomerase-like protein (cupin superfamily)